MFYEQYWNPLNKLVWPPEKGNVNFKSWKPWNIDLQRTKAVDRLSSETTECSTADGVYRKRISGLSCINLFHFNLIILFSTPTLPKHNKNMIENYTVYMYMNKYTNIYQCGQVTSMPTLAIVFPVLFHKLANWELFSNFFAS